MKNISRQRTVQEMLGDAIAAIDAGHYDDARIHIAKAAQASPVGPASEEVWTVNNISRQRTVQEMLADAIAAIDGGHYDDARIDIAKAAQASPARRAPRTDE